MENRRKKKGRKRRRKKKKNLSVSVPLTMVYLVIHSLAYCVCTDFTPGMSVHS